MKTAFITLVGAALLSLAHGATVLTLDSNALQTAGGSYTLTEGVGDGSYGNFSVTMAMDAQAFQNAILAGNIKTNLFTANNKIGLGLNYVSTDTPTAGLYGSWNGGDYNRSITAIDSSDVNLSTGLKALFTENSYESIAITYQISSAGTRTYMTLVDSEGSATTYGGQEEGLKTNSFDSLSSFTYGTDYVKYIVVDDTTMDASASQTANLNAIAAASVPEPTTATLSLLGLAGLMLRRRK